MESLQKIPQADKKNDSLEDLEKGSLQEAGVGSKITRGGMIFEKRKSGWVNTERPDFVILLEMPFGQELETLHRAQAEEKLGEVTQNGMVFERKKSGWINTEKPDYVIPLTTPMGKNLERLYEATQNS